MSRKIDKTKSSNIKCEHCKYWAGRIPAMIIGSYSTMCKNEKSQFFGKTKNYWNRCKQFEWSE